MRREQVHRLICLRCWCLNGALPFRPEAPPPWRGQDKQRLLRPACPPGLTPALALLRPEPPSPCSREGNHFKVPTLAGRHSLPLVRPGRGQEGSLCVKPAGRQTVPSGCGRSRPTAPSRAVPARPGRALAVGGGEAPQVRPRCVWGGVTKTPARGVGPSWHRFFSNCWWPCLTALSPRLQVYNGSEAGLFPCGPSEPGP